MFNSIKTLSIPNFMALVERDGFARLNRIAVRINPPATIAKSFDAESFSYYAESVTIPGLQILTNEVNLNGPPTTYPTRTDYRPGSTVSFLVDDRMSQRLFFDAWMNFIVPKERGFDIRYRDDYIGKMTVFQISEDGNSVVYGVEMFEVYPISVGLIKGNWAEQEVARMDVDFSYRYWRNLSKGEVSNDKILDELLGVTVTGTRTGVDIIDSVVVTGTRDNGTLTGVTVTGTLQR